MPPRRCPSRLRDRSVPPFPGLPAFARKSLANACEAYFLSGRGGRRDREQVAGKAAGLGAALLRPSLNGGPPRRREYRGQREHGEEQERRMNRGEQRERDSKPQDPSDGRKYRH